MQDRETVKRDIDQACARHEIDHTKLAKLIGFSRGYVSEVYNGSKEKWSDEFEARVKKVVNLTPLKDLVLGLGSQKKVHSEQKSAVREEIAQPYKTQRDAAFAGMEEADIDSAVLEAASELPNSTGVKRILLLNTIRDLTAELNFRREKKA